ncbi:MAG: gamma-butyrobetaine hydroxylase-like domain-containing protein [Deltaproteobacteria bacterium]|jgi:DUF971 family protein
MHEPLASPEPIELRAPRGARVLEIAWSDGSLSTFPHSLLRGFCPCAYCQGHQGPIRWAADAPDESLAIDDIEEVGNYAIRLGWADGHSTGIYSFRFLRELHPLAALPLEEARSRSFGR